MSPDGSRIAFTTMTSEGLEEDVRDGEVWVMGADGSAPHPLTHNQVDEEQELQWSEDGHPWSTRWYGVVRRDPAGPLPWVVHVR